MSKQNLYLGGAGQHAVVSEFLVRGWNVAIPEVDVGDDIFVVRDHDHDSCSTSKKALLYGVLGAKRRAFLLSEVKGSGINFSSTLAGYLLTTSDLT